MNLLPLSGRGFRRQMGSWGGLAIFTSEGVCVATRASLERGMSSWPKVFTLPEGTVVTVTIGEAELLRASLRSALRRSAHRRRRGRMLRPAFAGIGGDMA